MTVLVRGGEGAFLLWLLFKIFGCLHFFLRTFIPCSIALYVWWVRGAGEWGGALTVGGADASSALFFPRLTKGTDIVSPGLGPVYLPYMLLLDDFFLHTASFLTFIL